MRVLLLDIETSPNLAFVWGLWDQNVALNQIQEAGEVLCWSAKWLNDGPVFFDSVKKSGKERMLKRIHKLICDADAVVHYNGVRFDVPWLNAEFVTNGMLPPSPYKNIDVMLYCKRLFKFPSNKLDYVAQALGFGGKAKHEGFDLWKKCMEGDRAAWKKMQEYNEHDVLLLEKVYNKILPWMATHPNRSAFDEVKCCPNCASTKFQARGYAFTRAYRYKRYQCNGCGAWFRGKNNVSSVAPQMRQICG